ncbi:MAG: gene transfer agent family protein [Erythrobacter sp.]
MSAQANSLRGETEFTILGTSYILRPTFDALVAAEEEVGSLFAIVDRASEGSLKIAEILALLWHCIDPVQRPDRDALGKAILENGLLASTKPVRMILAQVIKGRQ